MENNKIFFCLLMYTCFIQKIYKTDPEMSYFQINIFLALLIYIIKSILHLQSK